VTPTFAHKSENHERPIEKWYYQLSIGRHFEKYRGDINTTIQRVDKNTKTHQSHGEVTLVGLYVPVLNSRKSLLGVKAFSGGWDQYDDEIISLTFFGPSFSHYFDSIGKGPFTYTDLGVSRLIYKDSKIGEKDINKSGFAIRLGVGYAKPIFKETSILISIQNTIYLFEIGQVNALSANIGFLW
jgi:hypothetical protein